MNRPLSKSPIRRLRRLATGSGVFSGLALSCVGIYAGGYISLLCTLFAVVIAVASLSVTESKPEIVGAYELDAQWRLGKANGAPTQVLVETMRPVRLPDPSRDHFDRDPLAGGVINASPKLPGPGSGKGRPLSRHSTAALKPKVSA